MTITDFPEVKEAQTRLSSAESRLSRLQTEQARIPEQVEDLKKEISEAEATAEVDGRSPNEDHTAQELRDELKAKRSRADEIADEIATAERVVSKLEDRLRKAKQSALRSVQDEATSAAAVALEEALSAIAELQAANERLQKVSKEYQPLFDLATENISAGFATPTPVRPDRLPIDADLGAIRGELEEAHEAVTA